MEGTLGVTALGVTTSPTSLGRRPHQGFISFWSDPWCTITCTCAGDGTPRVAPEAYKSLVGALPSRCGTQWTLGVTAGGYHEGSYLWELPLSPTSARERSHQRFISLWGDPWCTITCTCAGDGTPRVAPEAYKPLVGAPPKRCGTRADDARLPTPSVDVPVSENVQTEVPNVTMDESTGFVRDPGMRKEPNSFHRASEQAMTDLMKQSQHIQKVLENFNSDQIASNRLQLKASIDVVKVLAFQGLAFRGRDESSDSINRGNFLEILDLVVSYNEYVAEAIEKAPKNASYKSPKIQKEILHVFSNKVKKAIREEIGDAKFCLIVDEARDNLDIQDIRGQGYDGASNMQGEWNGLKALVSNDCPYAYYIHCFAHRLQLALVAASKEVILVQSFFNRLSSIVNVVGASYKRVKQLKKAYADQIAYFVEIGELETGRGLNQISTLQRAGDTRWGSHLRSISSLVNIFSPTCEILLKIIKEGNTTSQREAGYSCYHAIISFEFVFILHLMKEIMKITDALCQALQCQSQDILNAMNFVSSTKALIQKFRDEEWDNLLTTVKSFCEARDIDVPDMNARYVERGGLARFHQDDFTIEHHYRVDIFYAAIDSILQELNHRFSKHAVELLNLSSALDPKEARKSFRSIDILLLVSKFYPKDFTNQEMTLLKTKVDHYEHNVVRHPDFKKLSSISELCQWLVKIRKSLFYPYIYRLITLVLTLSVSTATTERAFSAMNIIKNRLRNKKEDNFLMDSMILYIEKEIAAKFGTESIIDDFRDLKEHRVLNHAEELFAYVPVFYKLTRLSLESVESLLTCGAVQIILQNSPCLDFLDFQMVFCIARYNKNYDWVLDKVPTCFVTHLKTIEISEFRGDEEEMHAVKIFLEVNMTVNTALESLKGWIP
ncbi:hypothetical protein SO802_017737 [Lithocarpus litseifolius]|uniref:Zinc finger MYM-type protein 1-like n=1 Tax=Lithocarpus litseifolius TaxID=425828 RepID=A0AAW2CN60_9ROSI